MHRQDLREATRKKAARQRRKLSQRLTKGEKKNAKRMATVAAVYTVAPFARTADQVVRNLAGYSDPDAPKRPRPEDKRVWASVVKPADEVLEEAFAEAESRDIDHAKTWVALVDGNEDVLQTLSVLAAARSLRGCSAAGSGGSWRRRRPQPGGDLTRRGRASAGGRGGAALS